MDILKSLGHPEELLNLFKFKMGGCRAVMPKLDYVSKTPVSEIFTVNKQSCQHQDGVHAMVGHMVCFVSRIFERAIVPVYTQHHREQAALWQRGRKNNIGLVGLHILKVCQL